ncbi:hypothetical protein OPAG_01640 [Rhodococcus opacus PD630]|uniref:hypothetical protein n=1 Tax=Rhodococcus TaxID=1827 RepID=UPI00029CB66F|nr:MULTISPECIES: hypothetical protein [Rhodococcus]AHK34483.1 hypothetical protein Pd630_LPD07298 [Rhodococcus opacus PD630]EHI39617.1 hypothetical protein OPAG_01640 [Rhodococcus opacus PD630]
MSTASEPLAVERSRLGAVRSTTVSHSLDQLRAAYVGGNVVSALVCSRLDDTASRSA